MGLYRGLDGRATDSYRMEQPTATSIQRCNLRSRHIDDKSHTSMEELYKEASGGRVCGHFSKIQGTRTTRLAKDIGTSSGKEQYMQQIRHHLDRH